MRKLKDAIEKNYKEVKDKITEVLNQAVTNPCSSEELKKEGQVTLKLLKRIGFHKEKALEIKTMTSGRLRNVEDTSLLDDMRNV